jgi:hypothetical protein
MSSQNLTLFDRDRKYGYGALVIIIILLNCGAPPLEPINVKWLSAASTAVNVNSIAADENGLISLVGEFPPSSSESQGRILRWNGSALEEVYTVEDKNSELYDIDFAGGIGWAVGTTVIQGKFEAVLLKYEKGRWARVRDVPTKAPFYSVAATSEGSFWVTTADGIYRYDSGNWSERYELPDVTSVGAAPSGLIFAWPVGDFIWVFNGAEWVKEYPDLPKGFTLSGISGAAPTEGGIYFACTINFGEMYYSAILLRDLAPAGGGVYVLPFFAPPGPYVLYSALNCTAFRRYNNGIALGQQTHIICDNGEFHFGTLPIEIGAPEQVTFEEVGKKYWMAARNEGGTYSLYYLIE